MSLSLKINSSILLILTVIMVLIGRADLKGELEEMILLQDRGGQALATTIAMVQGRYFEKGYVYANINPVPSYDSTFVDFEMVVTEGGPAYVAHIFITGNTRTKEHVIRRELLLKPGFLFSRNLFERSLREVMALNYFTNVELDPPPTPTIDNNLDVTIKVTERPTGQAMFGAGWSERDGLIGNIGITSGGDQSYD